MENTMKELLYEYHRDKDDKMLISHGTSDGVSPHFHRNLEIHYILSDNVLVRVGGESFIAGKDDVVFVHNYAPHALDNRHEKYFIIVPPYYAGDLDKSLSKKTLPPLLCDKEFNKTIFPFIKEIYDQKEMPSLVKKGYLNIIVGSLLSHYPTRPVERAADVEFIVKVLQYIEEHYSDELDLDSLSRVFGYNKYYFSRLFNRSVDVNLTSYINSVRLRYFMKLVKERGTDQITKLALLCGFESVPTFYRCFSKAYGSSPKEYFNK